MAWRHPSLDADADCDTCVIGGGISGLAVAYELTQQGQRVVVLEAGAYGEGETARSTAHLVTALDERYQRLETIVGPHAAAIMAQDHLRAIEWIEQVTSRSGHGCGFSRVPGYLVVPRARSAEAADLLRGELEASLRAGVEATLVPAHEILGADFPGGALRYAHQAQVNPVQLVGALASGIHQSGGLLFGGTRAIAVQPGNAEQTVCSDRRTVVRCRDVVVATHGIPRFAEGRVRSLTPMVSIVTVFELREPATFNSGVLLWDGYWDDNTPYHYVRMARHERAGFRTVVLVGGEDHEGTSPTPLEFEQAVARLERWTRAHIPAAGARLDAWWGVLHEPHHERALIGPLPGYDHVYLIAGDSGNGMTYAAIAARRIANMIRGHDREPNPYGPTR